MYFTLFPSSIYLLADSVRFSSDVEMLRGNSPGLPCQQAGQSDEFDGVLLLLPRR